MAFNPIALRMAKTPLSFGHSECKVDIENERENKWDDMVKFPLMSVFAGHLVATQ